MFQKSHQDVLDLADTFTNEELFSKNVYKWVRGTVLGSYFVSATSSHYDWAMKKLKAHQKNCKAKIVCRRQELERNKNEEIQQNNHVLRLPGYCFWAGSMC